MKRSCDHPNTATARPSSCPVPGAKRAASAPPFRSSLILLAMVLMAGGVTFMVWRLYREQLALYHSMALQGTSIQVETIKQFRRVYSTEVAARAQAFGIEVAHDFERNDRALPLPATFTMILGEALNRERPGAFL